MHVPTPQGTLLNVEMEPLVETYRVYGRVTDGQGAPLARRYRPAVGQPVGRSDRCEWPV